MVEEKWSHSSENKLEYCYIFIFCLLIIPNRISLHLLDLNKIISWHLLSTCNLKRFYKVDNLILTMLFLIIVIILISQKLNYMSKIQTANVRAFIYLIPNHCSQPLHYWWKCKLRYYNARYLTIFTIVNQKYYTKWSG